jgi:ABC-2 type transport system permease protein
MALISAQAQAILVAQFRAILNFYRKPQMGGYWIGTIVMAVWYLMLAGAGVGLAVLFAQLKPSEFRSFELVLTFGLLAAFLYWQVVPVLLASTGMSLESRKLKVYPVSERDLFLIEVMLRLSTGVEVLILLAGLFVGLIRNPEIPWWGPFTLGVYVGFNLFLSAGVKDLVARLMERKGVREIVVLAFVLLMVTPQMVAVMGLPPAVRQAFTEWNQSLLPWGVAAELAMGLKLPRNIALSAVYLGLAVWFGQWQFHRSLHFDADSVRAAGDHGGTTRGGWADVLFRWPRLLFADPLGALVEKEMQSLARSARFRLVFFMGFTFGLVLWLPIVFGRQGWMSSINTGESNFLTWISVYSVMMLGEVALFNSFGFDRTAAQLYWIAPVKLRTVLLAKNITASVYIFLELAIISIVCLLLRLPVGGWKVVEAFAVTAVLSVFFAGLGNLGTVYYPRSADPQNAWRSRGGSKFQMWMLLAYPMLAVPVGFAYLARYAFDSRIAFFVMLGVCLGIAGAFYRVALDTAEEVGQQRREDILTALSKGDGPIGT